MNLWSTMPKASGTNAIEIWMIACMLMVCGSILEYGVILFIMLKKESFSTTVKVNNSICKHDDKIFKVIHSTDKRINNEGNNAALHNLAEHGKGNAFSRNDQNHNFDNKTERHDIMLRKVDNASLIVFPIIFLLFIILYFSLFQK